MDPLIPRTWQDCLKIHLLEMMSDGSEELLCFLRLEFLQGFDVQTTKRDYGHSVTADDVEPTLTQMVQQGWVEFDRFTSLYKITDAGRNKISERTFSEKTPP